MARDGRVGWRSIGNTALVHVTLDEHVSISLMVSSLIISMIATSISRTLVAALMSPSQTEMLCHHEQSPWSTCCSCFVLFDFNSQQLGLLRGRHNNTLLLRLLWRSVITELCCMQQIASVPHVFASVPLQACLHHLNHLL